MLVTNALLRFFVGSLLPGRLMLIDFVGSMDGSPKTSSSLGFGERDDEVCLLVASLTHRNGESATAIVTAVRVYLFILVDHM